MTNLRYPVQKNSLAITYPYLCQIELLNKVRAVNTLPIGRFGKPVTHIGRWIPQLNCVRVGCTWMFQFLSCQVRF